MLLNLVPAPWPLLGGAWDILGSRRDDRRGSLVRDYQGDDMVAAWMIQAHKNRNCVLPESHADVLIAKPIPSLLICTQC